MTNVFHTVLSSSPYDTHNWAQLPAAPLAKPSPHRLAYQKNKSVFDTARGVARKSLDLARTVKRCARGSTEYADDTLASHQSRQCETEQHPFRQSYVFHTIPKGLGVKPIPDSKTFDRLYLHEEFQFRHIIVQVAVILGLIVSGLVLGIHFRYVAGLQGLGLYLRLLWISSWITGLLTLVFALWFRFSDYACSWFV